MWAIRTKKKIGVGTSVVPQNMRNSMEKEGIGRGVEETRPFLVKGIGGFHWKLS